MLSHRIDGIGVDCNKAADGTVDAALRDAVNEITDSKGSLQSVHWEKFQSCGDCTVYFQISYNNVPPCDSRKANARIVPHCRTVGSDWATKTRTSLWW